MNVTLNLPPHNGTVISLAENAVTVLVGKNAAGKSRILQSIKQQNNNSILLTNNYETVQGISTVNKESVNGEQIRERYPTQVQSLVASDPALTSIFKFFFKTLFESDLKEADGQFQSNGHTLTEEADGVKSIFNLFYYLVSPHKMILLDEPERFLHPSMRGIFLSMLSEIAKNYKKIIVISSHSNLSIRYDLNNLHILHVQKNPKKITDIKNWIAGLTHTVYTDPKHVQSFKDWFYYHTNTLFAKKVALVEGVSDQIVLEALKNKLSFQYGLENITIHHVASSHHEKGGKGRLHKMQSFLQSLVETFVIADKDVIATDLNKWYVRPAGEAEADTIQNAKASKLFMLPKGDIEDYYFLDASYQYCTSVANAKASKIPSAYEQAGIIYTKNLSEIVTQFEDVVNILRENATNVPADDLLKPIAKGFIRQKYVGGESTSPHISGVEDASGLNISFNFTSSARNFKVSKSKLDQLKAANDEIDKDLA